MGWWMELSEFLKGFICGGIAIPLGIVLIEIVVKLVLHRKIFQK